MARQAKHIIIFLPALTGGGAERVMLALAEKFSEKGARVDLVLASFSGPYTGEVPSAIHVHDLRTGRVSKSVLSFYRFLKKYPRAVVFTTLQYSNIFCLSLKICLRIPNKVYIRESNAVSFKINRRTLRGRFFSFLIKRVYPFADGIVAVSSGVKSDLIENFNIPECRISVIPNPVVFPEKTCSGGPLLHPWLKQGHPPVILGVGRLEKQKDFSTLLKAFATIQKTKPCRLIILGEGSERQALLKTARSLNVAEALDLPGFVADPFNFMKKAKVFVLCSRWEGFPNVLIQALACGCRVVSTDCPFGPSEILENGKYGILVPVGDADKLANALESALVDQPFVNNHIDWSERYSIEKIVVNYLRYFGYAED